MMNQTYALGFASFLETVCTDAFDPNFQILTQFVNSKIVPVMKLDSLESSHPVEVPIKDTKQIMEIFDLISYSKGASINRMLYNFLGGDVFRKGLTNYLNHFAYKNASTDDLWNFLGLVSSLLLYQNMAPLAKSYYPRFVPQRFLEKTTRLLQ